MLNGRAACRSGHSCEPESHKEALHCAVMHSAAGTQTVADAIGIKAGTLADACNPHSDDWLSLKHLTGVLVATADHPVLARYYAQMAGGVFFTLPQGEALATTATSIREFGEFLTEYATRAADGISAADVLRIEREGNEAIAAIAAVIADAKQRARGTAPLREVAR